MLIQVYSVSLNVNNNLSRGHPQCKHLTFLMTAAGDTLLFIFNPLYLLFFFIISSPPDMAQTEESAGQRLLDMEEEKKQRENELENLGEQLRQCTAKSQITDSELQYPFKMHLVAGVCYQSKNPHLCSVFCEPCPASLTHFLVSILNPTPDFCRESWRVCETPNMSFRVFRTRWMKTPPRSSLQRCECHLSVVRKGALKELSH